MRLSRTIFRFSRAFYFIALLLLVCLQGMAGVEPYKNQLKGSVHKGDSLIVRDEKFRNLSYEWTNINNLLVSNVITFEFVTDSTIALKKAFSCELDLKIEYWSAPDQREPIVKDHVPLKINFNPEAGSVYQQIASYSFKNGHQVKVTINDVKSEGFDGEMPPVFQLTAQVIVDRLYKLDAQPLVPYVAPVTATTNGQMGAARLAFEPTASALDVVWTKIDGATEYDLEWTYIDDESPNGAVLAQSGTQTSDALLAGMFKNNSTRVTLDHESYKISIVNDTRYMLVRLRTVSYDANNIRIEGEWSYKINYEGTVSAGVIVLPNERHLPGMNWSYSAVYAEQGKKKEVVSYFDGSGRGRQAVTVNNSDNVAVIQENVYDEFGRPVASILPAPIDEQDLKYYASKNLNSAGAPYSYKDIYNGSTGVCVVRPKALGATAGTGMYYSSSNPFKSKQGAPSYMNYIPDAEGYPFAVTRYTPDNTGRIALSGSVGSQLQPDANPDLNKTVRNYYGKPEQWELDELFGNDAGDYSHYLKTTVVDQNGQASLTYKDAAGRVIATALAGPAPGSLSALPSQPEPVMKKFRWIEPKDFVFDQGLLQIKGSANYTAPIKGLANVDYSIEKLIKKYQENGVTICSNCYYQLKISMYDDCNLPVYSTTEPVKIGSATADCNATGSHTGSFPVDFKKIGTYYVTFELTLSEDVIEAYTKDFIEKNTNLKSEFAFVLEELKEIDFNNCFGDCKTCSQSLGERANFLQRLRDKLVFLWPEMPVADAAYTSWADGLYTALSSNCAAKQASCAVGTCENLERQLLVDVSPGGQYSLFDDNGVALEQPINILHLYFRTEFPISAPGSALYESEKIYLEDGTTTSPYAADFTEKMLVDNWKPEWAAKFLKYHPEKCALDFCRDNRTYLNWDEKVKNQILKVTDIPNIQTGLSYQSSVPEWLIAADPFFKSGPTMTLYQGEFKEDLKRYSVRVLKNVAPAAAEKGLTKYVDFLLYCADTKGNTNTSGATKDDNYWNDCIPNNDCRIPDREWELYKQYYFELKEKYYNKWRNITNCSGACLAGDQAKGNAAQAPDGVVADFCSRLSYLDFNQFESDQSQSGNVFTSTFTITYKYSDSRPIPPNTTVRLALVMRLSNSDTITISIPFTLTSSNSSQSVRYTYYAGSSTMTREVNILSCENNICPAGYKNKESRIIANDYDKEIITDTTQLEAEADAEIDAKTDAMCEGMVTHWLQQLADCINSKPDPAGTRERVRDALLTECKRTAGRDYPFGYSDNFAALLANIGIGFTPNCNPWVLDLPPATTPKAQRAETIISSTNESLCSRLAELHTEHIQQQPGISFYQYLVNKYGPVMTLTAAELTALDKGCSNCRYLLEMDIKLPSFFVPGTKDCINGTEYNQAINFLKTNLAPLDVNHPNYETIVTNYLNQKWGFSYGYGDYYKFEQSLLQTPGALLCNSPAFTSDELDPYACMFIMAEGAVDIGRRRHDLYVDSVKNDFRRRYVAICGAGKVTVDLNASRQRHHFTLYYYDQAGNLVRTVPPEGVQLLNDEELSRVQQARTVDAAGCNYLDTWPSANTPVSETVSNIMTALEGNNRSVEMWLYNAVGSPSRVVTAMASGNVGKYLFNVCLDGRYLSVDIYTFSGEMPGDADITFSNHVSADLNAILPLRAWTHVVLQGSLMTRSSFAVYVNGVACPLVSNAPITASSWDVLADNTGNTWTQNFSNLKHIRFYNRLLTGAEIAANAAEKCLGLSPQYLTALTAAKLGWGRFNTPAAGAETTVPGMGTGTTEQQNAPYYPSHRLVTNYAYHSLDKVVKQETPDGGASTFMYDENNRLFLSRNAKQAATKRYSYTTYDALNRITEVGEKNYTGGTVAVSATGFYTPASVQTILAFGSNSQLIRTFYDSPYPLSGTNPVYPQENLRKRVAASVYLPSAGIGIETGTYFTYDLSGNVKTIWQQIYGLAVKKIDYQYDLVSGKVNTVRYQQGAKDQFYYGYEYDAENRLTSALSGIASASADGWSITNPRTDAHYQYYLHGPLARLELGHNGVQRIDYAYTLQGWLKGINSQYLDPAAEMGSDNGSAPLTFGKDVMAYSLDYFNGDYKPVTSGAGAFKLKWETQDQEVGGQSLYNGNISRATVALSKVNNGALTGYSYHYDQLNRLVNTRQHSIPTSADKWDKNSITTSYLEDVKYDGNGNILTYLRNGANANDKPLEMDKLSYRYNLDDKGRLVNNRLRSIGDEVGDGNYAEDIDNQADNNYLYDPIGNLVSDQAGNVKSVEWSVYGKISKITKPDGSSLEYKYDAGGNRVYKQYRGTDGKIAKTWYVRDAQGNVLGVYGNKDGDAQTYWKEQHLYGSSRLGMWTPNMNISNGNSGPLWDAVGLKTYELGNHLGNVLATISDKKNGAEGNYEAEVTSTQDYYPFGMVQSERKWALGSYRYGFNGQERSSELSDNNYTARFWEYDSRIGKRWNLDPVNIYFESLYSTFHNNPNLYADPLGLYGSKRVAEKMRDRAKRAGLDVGDVYYRKDQEDWVFGETKTSSRKEVDGTYSVDVNSLIHSEGRYFGSRGRRAWDFLTDWNPIRSVEAYVGFVLKKEVNIESTGTPVKFVVPLFGGQIKSASEGKIFDPKWINFTSGYVNGKIEGIDVRYMPLEGALSGDYAPGYRVLFTIAKNPIVVPIADAPVKIGEWKIQADEVISPRNVQIGARAVAESIPLQIRAAEIKLEVNSGVRFRLKWPDIITEYFEY